MSTRQTLKNFLSDRGLPSVNTISYNNTITSGDSPVLLDEGDDLSFDPNTGRRLIHDGSAAGLVPDYLGYITEKSNNTYKIDGSNFDEAPASNRGNYLQPPESQGAIDVFKASSEYPDVQNYFDGSGNPVDSIIDKVGAGAASTGPDLIDTVIAADAGSDVISGQSKAVTAPFSILKKYNKYADAAGASDPKFVESTAEGGTDTSANFDDAARLNFQRSSGEYKIGDTATSRQIPLRDVHDIAHSMLLKAAGWDTSTTAYTSDNPENFFDSLDSENFESYPNIISSLFPDQIRARESYGAPTVGESSLLAGAGESVQRDGTDAKYSRASTNSYTPDITFTPVSLDSKDLVKFSLYQAAISIVALSILIQQTINNFSEYTKNDNALETLGLGPFHMGQTTQSKVTASLRAISNIALINTGRFSFEKCVKAGVTLYFGIDLTSVRSSSPVDTTIGAFVGENQESAIETIGQEGNNKSTQDRLAQSYGFWQSVARSSVKLISEMENALAVLDTSLYANLIAMLLNSKALRIANVFAQIGYTYMIAHLEGPTKDSQSVDPLSKSKKLVTPFSVDSFDSLPGTRVMKSRDLYARSALALAWRHGSVPSALLLPPSLIQASLDMDYILKGPNPVKMLASTTLQDKTYVSSRNLGRIPIEVVNNLENRLDAEYVPFYFHDLRTNELIGLHAFLDSLTDNYTATYSPTQAYGRADAIKNYSNTKRSVSFSFWLVSTSEDDFDEMWAKINKLVTLVYPQYTKGTLVTAKGIEFGPSFKQRDFRFEQPFSQVIGGTPVIRLRIGDVIKSNYSRFNLSRLFGAGNTDTGGFENIKAGKENTTSETSRNSAKIPNAFSNAALLPLLAVIASPAELGTFSSLQSGTGAIRGALIYEAADLLLKNGFVNPLLPGLLNLSSIIPTGKFTNILDNFFNSAVGGKIFLKPRAEPYVFEKDQQQVFVKVTRPIQVEVKGLPDNPAVRTDESGSPLPVSVKVSISTLSELDFAISESFIYPQSGQASLRGGATCDVTLDQCLFDPDSYFSFVLAGLMFIGASSAAGAGFQALTTVADTGLATLGIPTGATDLISDFMGSFMRQWTSPLSIGGTITHAMEDSMSRGLAGVVTSINFTWIDPATTWDIRWNSRAPIACKITMGFDPIHDISPGLDVYGANRAPNYNVGAMRLVSGDPISVDGLKSREFFERNGAEPQIKSKVIEPIGDAISNGAQNFTNSVQGFLTRGG